MYHVKCIFFKSISENQLPYYTPRDGENDRSSCPIDISIQYVIETNIFEKLKVSQCDWIVVCGEE